MSAPRSVGAYRTLVRLYPRPFRAEYGEDMALLFADQLCDEGVLRVWCRGVVDLLISVPNRHLEAHMKRPSPMVIPAAFAVLSVSSLLVALVVGSSVPWLVFALTGSMAAGAVSYLSTKNVRAGSSGRFASQWWKLVLVGVVGLAALIVAANVTGELPDNTWFVFMGVLFASIITIGVGLALGLIHLASRRTRNAV